MNKKMAARVITKVPMSALRGSGIVVIHAEEVNTVNNSCLST